MANVVEALTGGVAAVAIGEAGSAALDPVFEPVKQDAWKKKPTKILEAGQLAELVAQALNAVSDVIDDVHRNGYASDEFTSLVQLALKAPGPPDAEKLFLRSQGKYPGAITQELLDHAYGKAGIEPQYWGALTAAAGNTLLSPAQLALGAVRGTLNDQGLLVVSLDTSDSNVQRYTPAALNIIDEAAASGLSEDRLRALIGSIGLPMAVQLAANATFRGILTKGAYYQAVLEGDTRPEWADPIFEVARQILTAHDYVEARLRNWIKTDAEMYAGTALHGMSTGDTDRLLQISGRPLNIHQVVTGLARGGTFGGIYDGVPEPFLSAVAESNIRPEFGNLDYANRYTYPTGFQIKAEATSGVLDQPTTEQILLEIGWDPRYALLFSDAWTQAKASSSGHVKSAQTQATTKLKQAYTTGSYTPAEAAAELDALDIPAADHAPILKYWDVISRAEVAIKTRTDTLDAAEKAAGNP